MNKPIEISGGLCKDEAVCFIANRYHTAPQKLRGCYLAHGGIISYQGKEPEAFILERNELEILRGLIFESHK